MTPRCSFRLLTILALLLPMPTQAQQPNILLICIDDMRPQIGAMGHPQMLTPNLDRLAGQGRLFKRHYVQVPTCGPSRAAMLTGKNTRQKSDINHHFLRQQLAGTPEPLLPETWVHHFKKHGYHTVGMGKISHSVTGVHYDKATKTVSRELPHSWSELLVDRQGPWGGGGQTYYASGQNRVDDDVLPFESMDLPDEGYPDGVMANMAVAKLKALSRTQKPFVMAVGFLKPHLPFNAPKKYWDLYKRDAIELSPNPGLPGAVDLRFLHPSGEFFGQYRGQRELGGVGKRLSDAYAREVIHGYYAATSFADAQVGKVLDELKRTGLDQNTIVVVWGDHGWHLGDHTIWGKHSTFERALKSLMIVRAPAMPEPGVATDSLVASIDLYPTLCDLAGLPKPDGLDGTSFQAVVENPASPGKPVVISYWRDILSLRNERYRMMVYRNGKTEHITLFDHAADPHETQNVAHENPEVVESLYAVMQANNRGFLPGLGE